MKNTQKLDSKVYYGDPDEQAIYGLIQLFIRVINKLKKKMKKKQMREFFVYSGDPEVQGLNDDIQLIRKEINKLKIK